MHHDMAAMHGMHAPTDPHVIANLDVVERSAAGGVVPGRLSALPPIREPTQTRTFHLSTSSDGMRTSWRINGDVYDPDRDAVEVRRGTVERWVISNAERSMPHPIICTARRSASSAAAGALIRSATWPSTTPAAPRDAALHVPLPHPRARGHRHDAGRARRRLTGRVRRGVLPRVRRPRDRGGRVAHGS